MLDVPSQESTATRVKQPKFDQDQEQLNLQPSGEGMLECRGRIQGEYPIYLPGSALLAAKIVQQAHVTTLNGESKREVQDTPSSEIVEESRAKMQRMQTFSSRGLCISAIETRFSSTLQPLCFDLRRQEFA